MSDNDNVFMLVSKILNLVNTKIRSMLRDGKRLTEPLYINQHIEDLRDITVVGVELIDDVVSVHIVDNTHDDEYGRDTNVGLDSLSIDTRVAIALHLCK